jgi:hypothetical protein
MLLRLRLQSDGGIRGKANSPAPDGAVRVNGELDAKRYGVGFFGAAAGFAAGAAAGFGLQNPGSALIQSSLT